MSRPAYTLLELWWSHLFWSAFRLDYGGLQKGRYTAGGAFGKVKLWQAFV